MMQPPSFKSSIYDLTYSELEGYVKSLNEPPYRTQQIWLGLYKNLWMDVNNFSNLPLSLRETLSDTYTFSSITPIKTIKSGDGETQKTAFELADGLSIETVLMVYAKRRTLCVSTQAGCAMGCVFCATGQMGFQRNLSPGEIVQQVLYYWRALAAADERITNIVFMGMGEPLHNYQATRDAISILHHPEGMNIGERRFTISTIGLVPEILRFAREGSQVNLAVSLHAADDKLRSSLLPINQKYPLDKLMAACQEYIERTNRRVTFEWALIHGVNDSGDQVKKLARLLQKFRKNNAMLCHVNIIPLNPTQGYASEITTRNKLKKFCDKLQRVGIPATIRIHRGIDMQAGCGQLATGTKSWGNNK
jgi:23S rRNA (adenine2503-C2)-methyltransferase